jgi:phosphoglucomutase
MSIIHHPATGFVVGDPEADPIRPGSLPSTVDLERALSGMILSASGWRKVFAADGNEDSLSEAVTPADLVLAGAAAMVFAGYLKRRSGRPDPTVLAGIDSRPTGPALADAMIRVFLGSGLAVRYLFIVPAPEIMAYSRQAYALATASSGRTAGEDERAEGFCYVSASHNPPGHNGFKVGVGGGVLPGTEIKPLIEEYRALLREPGLPARVLGLMRAADRKPLVRAYTECSAWKRRSVSAYTLLAREIVTGKAEPAEQEALLEAMAEAAAERPAPGGGRRGAERLGPLPLHRSRLP